MYLKSNTLLLDDVFENLRLFKMCLKIYHLVSSKFLSAQGLEDWRKIRILTDIDMLWMVEKELEEEYVTQFIDMQKLGINIWKIMIRMKNRYILNIWDIKSLSSLAMLQKLPVNDFEFIEDTSQFIEDFIKSYSEESDEGFFLDVDV